MKIKKKRNVHKNISVLIFFIFIFFFICIWIFKWKVAIVTNVFFLISTKIFKLVSKIFHRILIGESSSGLLLSFFLFVQIANLQLFCWRNAPLRELFLVVRSRLINDNYIRDLIKSNNLYGNPRSFLFYRERTVSDSSRTAYSSQARQI